MKADIIILDKRHTALARSAKRILEKAGKALPFHDAQCAVYIADDAQMEAVAKEASHPYHEGVTMLAFPADAHFPRPDLHGLRDMGDIYINPGYIQKKKENFSFMLIHGLLHLAGYDHNGKHDTLAMEKKEKELLATL